MKSQHFEAAFNVNVIFDRIRLMFEGFEQSPGVGSILQSPSCAYRLANDCWCW